MVNVTLDLQHMDRDLHGQSMVILPGTEAWATHRLEAQEALANFMDRIEAYERNDKFPWLLVGNSILIPPEPISPLRLASYSRINNCVEERSRPEAKWRQPREIGDDHISDTSHRLVHQAIAIVSQLQVIATAADYSNALEEFLTVKTTLLILVQMPSLLVYWQYNVLYRQLGTNTRP